MPEATIDDTTIWYDTAGDRGDPILFIQGVGAVGGGWRAQTDDLRADHRVAWFDNRGIGRSAPLASRLTIERMAADSLGLLDHLGWQRAHVVGHSMGGLVAQQLALDHPDRVVGLVLAATFARGRDVGKNVWRTLGMTLRTRLGPRAWRRRAMCDLVFPRSFTDRVGYEPLIAELEGVFGGDIARQPAVVMKQVRAARAHDISGRLGELTVPTLVVKATCDRIAPPDQGDELAALIPDAELATFDDAGHAFTIQCAPAFNQLVRRFLSQVSERRSPGP